MSVNKLIKAINTKLSGQNEFLFEKPAHDDLGKNVTLSGNIELILTGLCDGQQRKVIPANETLVFNNNNVAKQDFVFEYKCTKYTVTLNLTLELQENTYKLTTSFATQKTGPSFIVDTYSSNIVLESINQSIPEFTLNYPAKPNGVGSYYIREVPMPGILKTSLLRWREKRIALQNATNISLTDTDDLVFSTHDGKLRTYCGIKSMFDRLMKDAGLTKYHLHFHTLRHTYSSMLFESKENPKVIQMLLGHKDVTTTIKTYNSVDRSYFKQATDKLQAKFTSTDKS